MKLFFMLFLCCVLLACQNAKIEYKYPEKVKGRYEMPSKKTEEQKNDTVFNKEHLTFRYRNTETQRTPSEDNVFDKGIKNEEIVKKESLPDCNKIWTAMLTVLSRYPVSIIQEDKLIVTEWFNEAGKNQRQIKINALKTATDLTITVFSRTKDQTGEWINQKNDATLADKIKNDIVKLSMNE